MIILLILGSTGVYLLLNYRKGLQDSFSQDQIKRFERNRMIGYVLCVMAIVLGVYLLYTNSFTLTVKKARMYPAKECSGCEIYVKRHRGLRGYHVDEYANLAAHAESCNKCSQLCINDLQKQQKSGAPAEIQNYIKRDCISATEHAILAKKELDRLTEKLRSKQAGIAAFKATQFDDVSLFPKIPV